MKKVIALFLCLSFLYAPLSCAITDDFAENSLDKELKIKAPSQKNITDDFAEQSLDKSLQKKETKTKIISDDFAEKNKNKNPKIKSKVEYSEVLPQKTNNKTSKKVVLLDENDKNSVMVNIKKYFTTRQNADEGDYIEFETINEVKINNKTYPAGSTVRARIETLSLNQIWGVPSDLVVGNFSIDGIPLA